jgi:hypothetical protein
MVRKQVYIEPDQDAALKRRANELGVTESELIREGIDLVAYRPGVLPQDDALWQAALTFMRERGRLALPPGKRTWTREEVYDERWDRRPR